MGEMLNCDSLLGDMGRIALVEECDSIVNGMLRLATPFRYPNGSTIDLFIGADNDRFSSFTLTDLGQTTAELLNLGIKPWRTKKRKQLVADICESLSVQNDSGELKVTLLSLSELPGAMVRLAQACIRTSDLAFTQRNLAPVVFKDNLEEFISSLELPYEPDVILPGKNGSRVNVDFRVRGKTLHSLVFTVSSASSASAHSVAVEAFRKAYDLFEFRTDHQVVSVFDTANNVFKEEDIRRLDEVSTVLAYPEQQEELHEALAA